MNKKNIVRFFAFAAALIFLPCACTLPPKAPGEEKALADMQRLYKSAALVVVGECLQTHLNGAGEQCGDIVVTQTVAGTAADPNDVLHCPNAQMKVGDKYLLYLANGEDVYQSEDSDGFVPVAGGVFKLDGDDILLENGTISLGDVKTDIQKANKVISARGESYYYKNINELSNQTDFIFIGKVRSVPVMEQTRFRSNDGGSVTENELSAAILDVEVYGSIKGTLAYGQTINLVYCPAMCQGIIDAATLRSAGIRERDIPVPSENGIYLFFLSKGPDEKQDYYFGINQAQFAVPLNKDNTIAAGAQNKALSAFRSLNAVVTIIKKAIRS